MSPAIPPPLPPRKPIPVLPLVQKPTGQLVALWIGGIFAGVVILVGIGLAVWWNHRIHELPPREEISAAEKHQETRAAFVGSSANLSDPQSRAIISALDSLNTGIRTHNSVLVGRHFDADCLCDEVDRMGMFANFSDADKRSFRSGLAPGLIRGMTSSALLESTDRKVKKVKISDDGRNAVVYDLETRGLGGSRYQVKMRWWLHRTVSDWKVWDYESLEQGLRLSTIVAAGVRTIGSGTSPVAVAGPIIQSLAADISGRNWPKMETDLKQFDALTLPVEFRALRSSYWAILHVHQAKYGDALKDCDAVESTGQDVPMVHQLRAESYNHLGQYEKALASCKIGEDALGGELELDFQRGMALEHLHRTQEARDWFEKALDESPDAIGGLTELAKVLPADDKSELARRFSATQNPHAVFIGMMPTLQRAGDLAGMQTLIDAYSARTESADDTWLTYYRGELLVQRKQYKQAEGVLQPLVLFADQKGQAVFASEYYYAAVLAGDSISAYRSSADPAKSYHELARRLYTQGKYSTLRELTSARVEAFRDDPWACFYQGCEREHARDYPAAEAAYAKAMSLATGTQTATQIEEMRFRRVNSRFSAGDGLSAYQEVPPKDKTFLQLARLFASHKQADNLASLILMRRTDASDDVNLPFYDADAKFLQGNYLGAVALLASHRPASTTNAYPWRDLYIRSQVRLKNFDAARTELASIDSPDLWHQAMIETAAGNVPAATKALDAICADEQENGSITGIYGDPDMGPALSTAAFASWRQKHPQPATRPTMVPTTSPG